MQYEIDPDDAVLEVTFELPDDVVTVRAAFRAHNEHLRSLGNDGSIGEHASWVAGWSEAPQTYRGEHRLLRERLVFFAEETDDVVDRILDLDNRGRIKRAARRYELGFRAAKLIEELDLHQGISRFIDEATQETSD